MSKTKQGGDFEASSPKGVIYRLSSLLAYNSYSQVVQQSTSTLSHRPTILFERFTTNSMPTESAHGQSLWVPLDPITTNTSIIAVPDLDH